MTNNLRGDVEATIRFLTEFHPDGPWLISGIHPDTPGLTGRVFLISEREAAARYVEENLGRLNLYFGVNEPRPGFHGSKATKADIETATHAHVDIDHADGLVRLKAYELPPTFLTFSGGGYQAFWKLVEPTTDLDRVEAINKQLAADLGGDNCHNIDRIMRLPGTINLPNAKKRSAGRVPALAYVVERSQILYSLEHFKSYAEPAAVTLTSKARAKVIPVGTNSLPSSVPPRIMSLIEHGDDVDNPIGSEKAHYPSRSEVVIAVAMELIRCGCPAEQVAGILINKDLGISASIREKKNAAQYAWHMPTSGTIGLER